MAMSTAAANRRVPRSAVTSAPARLPWMPMTLLHSSCRYRAATGWACNTPGVSQGPLDKLAPYMGRVCSHSASASH